MTAPVHKVESAWDSRRHAAGPSCQGAALDVMPAWLGGAPARSPDRMTGTPCPPARDPASRSPGAPTHGGGGTRVAVSLPALDVLDEVAPVTEKQWRSLEKSAAWAGALSKKKFLARKKTGALRAVDRDSYPGPNPLNFNEEDL